MITTFAGDLSMPITSNRAARPGSVAQRTSGGGSRIRRCLTNVAVVQSHLGTADWSKAMYQEARERALYISGASP